MVHHQAVELAECVDGERGQFPTNLRYLLVLSVVVDATKERTGAISQEYRFFLPLGL